MIMCDDNYIEMVHANYVNIVNNLVLETVLLFILGDRVSN